MPWYNYECQDCGESQSQIVKLDQSDKEGCTKCSAGPEKLEKKPAAFARNAFNWSKWQVDG